MTSAEYAVNLTVDGSLTAWQQGAQTFESAMRDLGNGLVVAARVIHEYPRVDGAEEWLTDLSAQWWADLELLPRTAQKIALTRLVVAGVPTPQRFVVEEA